MTGGTMEGRSESRGSLSLRWIWLAWFAFAFTALGFVVFGCLSRGDPTPLIERLFGDTALFSFLVYTVGQGVAALLLIHLAHRRGLGLRDIGFTGRLTGRGALLALAGWFVAFLLYYIVEHFRDRLRNSASDYWVIDYGFNESAK